uniref:Uncharacterized protein n=1 Tax=Physcomitrium patens TaxID=3218 RepID=A9SQ60_PHYPA|nr:hypothetical protein PHYPA_009381 [Physcomitrium patens]
MEYTLQHNKINEQKNRMIVESICLMSIICQLLRYLWIKANYTINYLVNLSLIRTNQRMTLNQLYYKTKF